MSISDKLLTHRLRGFSANEASLSALAAAAQLPHPPRFVEIDTRMTHDGTLVVFHDSRLDRITQTHGRVAEYSVTTHGLPRFKHDTSETVVTLDAFCHAFANLLPHSTLCVDLKDSGTEAEHLCILRRHGLLEQSWMISWHPEILLAIHQLEPTLRLSFSHIPLTRWRSALRLAANTPGLGAFLRGVGRLLAPLGVGHNWRDVRIYLNRYNPTDLSPSPQLGDFPIHVLTHLPSGRLGAALRQTRGAVGIPRFFLTADYARAARAEGLALFVFSCDTVAAVCKVVQHANPDVIFTNNAELFRVNWAQATEATNNEAA